jgi:hypothetical protein
VAGVCDACTTLDVSAGGSGAVGTNRRCYQVPQAFSRYQINNLGTRTLHVNGEDRSGMDNGQYNAPAGGPPYLFVFGAGTPDFTAFDPF